MRLMRLFGVMMIVALAAILTAACGGDDEPSGDGATATTSAADETPPDVGDTFFLEIAAENTEYDVSELGPAPAGQDITLQFDNDDPGLQHNWSLYETEESEDPIFEGEILTGVDTIDYLVPAIDTPGTYHYHCDIHPNVMTGELIIE